MGWNVEVVAVKADEVDAAVPDVFFTTETTMGFEEATSVLPDLPHSFTTLPGRRFVKPN